MYKKPIFLTALALFATSVVLLLSGSGCNFGSSNPAKNDASEDGKLKVMVSVLPQVTFVERIGGDKVEVNEMIPPGFSPATYTPTPDKLKQLSQADLYVRIGHIPFEKAQMARLEKLNPTMTVMDSSKGIELRQVEAHHHHGEDEEEHHDEHGEHDDHGDHDDHNHEAEAHGEEHEEGDDPHIWVAPSLVKIQAENIYQALVKAKPEHRELFLANKNNFIKELDELDAQLKQAFTPLAGQTVLIYHPVLGYLADAYGFNQENIEIEGKEPTAAQLKEIIDEANTENIKVVFVQKQFSTKSAEAVASAIGGKVIFIDPLAKNYFDNLREMADTILESNK